MDDGQSTDASNPAPAPEVHAAYGVAVKKKIFLSRSSADKAVAQKLIPALQALGYEVWAQDHNILVGDDFRKWIDTALRGTDATVALLSDAYLKSEWCRDESVSTHRQSGRRLVPLLIEEGCQPDGLIASFVWLDVAVKMTGSVEAVARLIDEVLTEGKPLEESAAARDYLRRGNFVTNLEINENYVLAGREDETEQLDEMLGKEGAEVALTAVAGMGGVGKSYLARVWAVRNRMRYRSVWMVRAEQSAQMIEDLAELGGRLAPELAAVADKPAVAAAALAKLGEPNSGRPFLLIYDNVDAPDAIRSWRPKGGCRVLVTTRWRDWTGTGAQPLELEKLSPEGAIALLRDYGAKLSDEDAGRIAEELDYLPLALTQAAAVIRRSGLNAEEYLRDIERRIGEFPPSSGDYEASTRAALESNIDQLAKDNPLAPVLLEMAAYCAPEAVPLELWTTEAAKAVLPEALHDSVALKEALGALEGYWLAGVDRDNPMGWTVSLHRLVQTTVRARLAEADRATKVLTAAIESIWKLYPSGDSGDPGDVRNWPACERLQSHAEIALSRVSDDDAPQCAGGLSNQCGLYRNSRAEYAAAEPLLRRAVAIDEASYGSDHPDVATALNNLAGLLQETNRFAEAEPLLRRALAIDEASYGPDHPDVATDLNNLAELLRETNRLAEAEPLMRRALAIGEASFGPDHPTVALRLNNLAQLLRATDRLGEAEPLMRRALAMGEASYGPDHPTVALRLNNLAGLLRVTNRLEEAEPLLRRALAIGEASFGPDHPTVALRLSNLAELLHATNRLEEAESLMRRALAMGEASYGPDHPTVALRLNNLAQLLHATNRLEEAEPLMRRAHVIFGASLPMGHPSIEMTRTNLKALLADKSAVRERADGVAQGEVDASEHWIGSGATLAGRPPTPTPPREGEGRERGWRRPALLITGVAAGAGLAWALTIGRPIVADWLG